MATCYRFLCFSIFNENIKKVKKETIYNVAVLGPTLGHCRGESVTKTILTTALNSHFDLKVARSLAFKKASCILLLISLLKMSLYASILGGKHPIKRPVLKLDNQE